MILDQLPTEQRLRRTTFRRGAAWSRILSTASLVDPSERGRPPDAFDAAGVRPKAFHRQSEGVELIYWTDEQSKARFLICAVTGRWSSWMRGWHRWREQKRVSGCGSGSLVAGARSAGAPLATEGHELARFPVPVPLERLAPSLGHERRLWWRCRQSLPRRPWAGARGGVNQCGLQVGSTAKRPSTNPIW
jgi:hypothetical protein